ncbi:skin secretory protein xP2-like [Hippopotamus amphibius kiboko]|uniref:skin secretory protein xP2-like n=1 Tax=Hippopotamus amphibius kiboko TaxID=575201 RepID=UPI00259A49F9|nr:skin secretory protein xP2-like [Hippopotamus amphibius kiboko]
MKAQARVLLLALCLHPALTSRLALQLEGSEAEPGPVKVTHAHRGSGRKAFPAARFVRGNLEGRRRAWGTLRAQARDAGARPGRAPAGASAPLGPAAGRAGRLLAPLGEGAPNRSAAPRVAPAPTWRPSCAPPAPAPGTPPPSRRSPRPVGVQAERSGRPRLRPAPAPPPGQRAAPRHPSLWGRGPAPACSEPTGAPSAARPPARPHAGPTRAAATRSHPGPPRAPSPRETAPLCLSPLATPPPHPHSGQTQTPHPTPTWARPRPPTPPYSGQTQNPHPTPLHSVTEAHTGVFLNTLLTQGDRARGGGQAGAAGAPLPWGTGPQVSLGG